MLGLMKDKVEEGVSRGKRYLTLFVSKVTLARLLGSVYIAFSHPSYPDIRCYKCRGLGHLARNCTVRPRKRDAAYLQTQLLIAQKEEAGIQLQAEEFNFMVAEGDLDEIEKVIANCILMANLQQASTSGTHIDKALVYDSNGSAEYTDLLEPIPEPHQVQLNDSDVISVVSSVEQGVGTVEKHPATVEETRVFVSQKAKSCEELYFSNTSKTTTVSKSISLPNEEFSDDTSLSVARKFLNEEAANFVRDFKSLAKHKALEFEIERLLRAVIERFQAQLGDLKGKSKDTLRESDTLDSLSQKLENENMELEF
ncbi:retrovirus-related pol polyprotein from transposon TNT 1-94 [Tanacetum coccineum]